jgi:hypothetical protein
VGDGRREWKQETGGGGVAALGGAEPPLPRCRAAGGRGCVRCVRAIFFFFEKHAWGLLQAIEGHAGLAGPPANTHRASQAYLLEPRRPLQEPALPILAGGPRGLAGSPAPACILRGGTIPFLYTYMATFFAFLQPVPPSRTACSRQLVWESYQN